MGTKRDSCSLALAVLSDARLPMSGKAGRPYRVSCSGLSITDFSVSRNSAASAPYTMRWSAVRLTVICFCTPMRPFASAVTVGLLPPTARIAAVPAAQPCTY